MDSYLKIGKFFFVAVLAAFHLAGFAQGGAEQQQEAKFNLLLTQRVEKQQKSVADALFHVAIKEGVGGITELFDLLKEERGFVLSESEMLELGCCLINMGKIEEALVIWKLNAEAFPASWQTYEQMGKACLILGNVDAAENAFDKATEIKGYQELEKDKQVYLGL